jgi:hypothetical protein
MNCSANIAKLLGFSHQRMGAAAKAHRSAARQQEPRHLTKNLA